eukprot:gene22665-43011_t
MAFGKSGKDKDRSTVIYNSNITMTNIPVEAYDYVVNGKPALEWVMERQGVKTDKDSGIVNDANRYAIETMNDPRYPFDLFRRVITVSLETMKIVRSFSTRDEFAAKWPRSVDAMADLYERSMVMPDYHYELSHDALQRTRDQATPNEIERA